MPVSEERDLKPENIQLMKFKRRWEIDVRRGPPITATVDGLTFTLAEGEIPSLHFRRPISLLLTRGQADDATRAQAYAVAREALHTLAQREQTTGATSSRKADR